MSADVGASCINYKRVNVLYFICSFFLIIDCVINPPSHSGLLCKAIRNDCSPSIMIRRQPKRWFCEEFKCSVPGTILKAYVRLSPTLEMAVVERKSCVCLLRLGQKNQGSLLRLGETSLTRKAKISPSSIGTPKKTEVKIDRDKLKR